MKSHNCIDTISPPAVDTLFDLPPWVGRAVRPLGLWIERSRQRRQLAMLSDAALKDIGLTREDVGIEIQKPFWCP